MPKKWTPTCAWLKKAGTDAKRALAAWHKVRAPGAACGRKPYWLTNATLWENLLEYAGLLGQKRLQLPKGDLAAFTAWMTQPVDGRAIVTFAKPGGAPIEVHLRNLDAWPAQPVEEFEAEIEWKVAA